MPKAPVVNVKGPCGFTLPTKTWKSGHSIKCERRGLSSLRYWQPDRTRYLMTKFQQQITDCQAECLDFCRYCRHRDNKYHPDEKECANCGVLSDIFTIIEECTPKDNPTQYAWSQTVKVGEPICSECYPK